MKRSFRINCNVTDTRAHTDETVELLRSHMGCIDEIAVFESFSHHGFWGPERTKERAAQLAYAIGEFRKIGVPSVGINVLCTIGHLDEGWDFLDRPDIGTVMGRGGEASKSCLCINAPGYEEYVAERYRIFASAHPDFIWVDDDFRYDNHKFPDVCYCPHCISKYNEAYGASFTRETLVAEIEQNRDEQKRWTNFRIGRLAEIARIIREAVASVDPCIELGLMTGPHSDRSWAEALGCKKLRPGGGFYEDSVPCQAFDKPMWIGLQNRDFAGIARDIQYEFENFPYQEPDKSDVMRRLECTLSLCFGCNGIAFNALGNQNDLGIMRVVEAESPYWQRLVEILAGKKPAGVCCEASDLETGAELLFQTARLGAPICLDKSDASMCIYTGRSLCEKTDDELLGILAGNVLLDTEAFAEVERRGFAKYCGCRTGRYFDNGMTERISGCALNGGGAGFNVNAYMNFWPTVPKVCELIPAEGALVLSNLESITGKVGKPCMTAFENELGGRVVVSSYFFINFSRFDKKREQLLRVFDWLCGDAIPLRVDTPARVAPLVRRGADETAVILTNLNFDPAENIRFHIPDMAGRRVSLLKGDREEGIGDVDGAGMFTLSRIEPWHEAVVIVR